MYKIVVVHNNYSTKALPVIIGGRHLHDELVIASLETELGSVVCELALKDQ